MVTLTIEVQGKTIQMICILTYSLLLIDKIIGLLKYLKQRKTKEKNNMALNLTSIKKAEIFENNEKGELDELTNEKTLNYFYETEKDGEKLIAFTVVENKGKFYFASGVLKQFLIDNIYNGFVDDDGNISFDETVKITYEGKMKSKNNRLYNAWSVSVQ